jgi:hypothetical protein
MAQQQSESGGISEVAGHQFAASCFAQCIQVCRLGLMGVDDADNLLAVCYQLLRQVAAILPAHACDHHCHDH